MKKKEQNMSVNPTYADLVALQESICKAQKYLLNLQKQDGSWKGCNLSSPSYTASVLVLEHFLGVLTETDAAEGAKWLKYLQREDGSFPAYPFAEEGDFENTCYGYAALIVAEIPESDTSVQKAYQFIEANGGMQKSRLETQIFLSMAGVWEPNHLPSLPLLHKLIPFSERLLNKFLASSFVLGANILPGLVRGLKNGKKNQKTPLLAFFRQLQENRIIEYLTQRQNLTGDWYGVAFFTILGAACLYALGIPTSDSRIQKALDYINERLKYYTPQGMHLSPSTSEVWDTALIIHALVESGLTPSAPTLQRACDYLLQNQGKRLVPKDWQNPHWKTPRNGGWSYQSGNQLGTDNDTTAIVLIALNDLTNNRNDRPFQEAIDKGLTWDLAMQNPDGGWAAWTWGHTSKKTGPQFLLRDASMEDLTGRVLIALAKHGYTKTDANIRKAIKFLQRQQEPNGSWWGRFFVNYLMGTSYVLSGLKAVGEDMNQSYIRKSVTWLKQHQNEDGGWGETVDSYHNQSLAGIGESMPTMTSIVVSALIDAGEIKSLSLQKGINHIIARQERDGGWQDSRVQGVLFSELKLYYLNYLSPNYCALEALGKYQKNIS